MKELLSEIVSWTKRAFFATELPHLKSGPIERPRGKCEDILRGFSLIALLPSNTWSNYNVATGNAIMKTRIVRIGNSKGIRIPKLFLEDAVLGDEVDITVHG